MTELPGAVVLPGVHQVAEQGDGLLHQGIGDAGEGRLKAGPDVVQVGHPAGGRDKFPGACDPPLIHPPVPGGDEADGLIGRPGVCHAGKMPL